MHRNSQLRGLAISRSIRICLGPAQGGCGEVLLWGLGPLPAAAPGRGAWVRCLPRRLAAGLGSAACRGAWPRGVPRLLGRLAAGPAPAAWPPGRGACGASPPAPRLPRLPSPRTHRVSAKCRCGRRYGRTWARFRPRHGSRAGFVRGDSGRTSASTPKPLATDHTAAGSGIWQKLEAAGGGVRSGGRPASSSCRRQARYRQVQVRGAVRAVVGRHVRAPGAGEQPLSTLDFCSTSPYAGWWRHLDEVRSVARSPARPACRSAACSARKPSAGPRPGEFVPNAAVGGLLVGTLGPIQCRAPDREQDSCVAGQVASKHGWRR